MWDAATGARPDSSSGPYFSVREGDGQADPTGNFYYHCDNNSSGAILRKYDIAADTFVQTVAGPQIGYGSRNLILSGDGKRLFWLGRTFDENLNTLTTMPSNAEVHATNHTGELAIGENAIWWSDSGTQLATLPFASTVATVSSNDAYLVRFNATTRTLHSTAVASLTDLPGPWPRPGQILNESPQRLSWTPVDWCHVLPGFHRCGCHRVAGHDGAHRHGGQPRITTCRHHWRSGAPSVGGWMR